MKLADSVVERDVCAFLLAVNMRVNQPFLDETTVDHWFVAKQQQLSQKAPVATLPPVDNPDLLRGAEVDRVCLGNVEACEEVQKKSVLPEMLRLEEEFIGK